MTKFSMTKPIQKYKVVIAQSGKVDVKERKRYIIEHFKYRELANNFSRKVKKAALDLAVLPQGYEKTEFQYRGYDIYFRPTNTYLLFFTIDELKHTVTVLRILQDGMNWKYIINRWLKENA